jgi:mono/diheme cytochrome c family protein
MRVIPVFLLAGAVAAAASFTADAQRGARVFQDEACIQCHSIHGKGGSRAPDLGKRTGREYTPATMASLMWNHAPAMWSAMKSHGITRSSLSEERAADLFAYLYSAKFFDKLGDAARGKRAFAARSCAVCHAETAGATGPPIATWQSLNDPVLLVHAMWTHAAGMRKQLESKSLEWPRLTSQELADILVYLQNQPAHRGKAGEFRLPPAEDGEKLFQVKSCANCHTGRLSLDGRLEGETLTGIAVAMWNHAPQMERTPIELTADQMRAIVSYVWGRQFFLETGSPDRGKRVFAAKNCAACHNDPSSGAPNLAERKRGGSPVSIISALWEHGPQMLARMNEKKLAWPRFNAQEMRDLIAYLRVGQVP